MESGVAETWTSAYTGYWFCRWQFEPLYYNNVYFPKCLPKSLWLHISVELFMRAGFCLFFVMLSICLCPCSHWSGNKTICCLWELLNSFVNTSHVSICVFLLLSLCPPWSYSVCWHLGEHTFSFVISDLVQNCSLSVFVTGKLYNEDLFGNGLWLYCKFLMLNLHC